MLFRRCAIDGMDYDCERKSYDMLNMQMMDNIIVNSELRNRIEVMDWQTDRVCS